MKIMKSNNNFQPLMDLLAVYYPDSHVLLKGENNSLCITKLRCRDYRDIVFYKQENRNISKRGEKTVMMRPGEAKRLKSNQSFNTLVDHSRTDVSYSICYVGLQCFWSETCCNTFIEK